VNTIKTPIVSVEDGYLPEFHIAYRSIRMVLWVGPEIQVGHLTLRPTEEPIGLLYKLKGEVGYFFVDTAGNGAMYETFREARDDLVVDGRSSQ
jgi:hypothetical protein